MKKIMNAIAAAALTLSASQIFAETITWHPAGATDESCAFQGSFDVLPGYPFARFTLKGAERDEIIPLAISDGTACDWTRFTRPRVRRGSSNVEVWGQGLCMSRAPRYTAAVTVDGVRTECALWTE